jgi:transcriptional regulator GlxA family with amidase domain
VAAQAGFGSAEVMRRVFLRLLGTTRSDYRARFGEREAAP